MILFILERNTSGIQYLNWTLLIWRQASFQRLLRLQNSAEMAVHDFSKEQKDVFDDQHRELKVGQVLLHFWRIPTALGS